VEFQLDLGPANDRGYSGIPRFLPRIASLKRVAFPFEVEGRFPPAPVHRSGDGGDGPLRCISAWLGSNDVGGSIPRTRCSPRPPNCGALFARSDDHLWQRESSLGIALAIDGCAGGFERLDSFRTDNCFYVYDYAINSGETTQLRALYKAPRVSYSGPGGRYHDRLS